MKQITEEFSFEDKLILNSYKVLVYGLADYLGKGYEIVLHSLENYETSVIAIINGEHTGRTVGSPITDLALNMLHKIEECHSADFISYHSVNRFNEPLKSTTIAIRGNNNKVIGLLCMNFYLNMPFATIMESILPATVGISSILNENYHKTASDLVDSSYKSVIDAVMQDSTIPASHKTKVVVERLYDQGIFNLKDSVLSTANELNVSKNTIYMHLRNLRKDK